MAGVCFEDDFHNRVRKQLQTQFRRSVIPSHLLPHLLCLTTEDEERVQAVERNSGPTLAADELFNLIIRRPNWTEDLTQALRDPDVKLDFLADEIEKLLKEIPMRWDISGFEDNFGRACFDGNCGTVSVEPMQHDEGDSQPLSSASVIETPEQEPCMELLKQQSDVGELKLEQCMKELKVTDETECKVKTDNDDTSVDTVSTEHEDNAESIEHRRANLQLKIMDKIWSFVKKPGDVPIALEYTERAFLQITSINKGSLLFKVNVNTLDELKRVQELVRYGGMKNILDKELVENHMEIFKDLAREERLELLSINSKLYIHQSDLERCKALLSASKDECLGVEDIGNLLTANFQNERDIYMMKKIKEILPPICIKMLKDPFLLKQLPQFFKIHAEAVTNASKRDSQIEPLTKCSIDEMLKDVDLLETRGRLVSEISMNIKGRLNDIRKVTEDHEELHVLFLKWVERELLLFFDSLDQGDLTLVIQGAAELMCQYMDPIPVRVLILAQQERKLEGLFDRFPNISIDFKSALTSEAYDRLEALGIIKRERHTFEFTSDLLRGIMFAYLIDTELDKYFQGWILPPSYTATIIAAPLYKQHAESKTPYTEGKVPLTKGEIGEDGNLEKPVEYEDFDLQEIRMKLESLPSYKFASHLLRHTQGNADNAIPSAESKTPHTEGKVPLTKGEIGEDGNLEKPVEYEDFDLQERRMRLESLFDCHLLQHTQGNADNAIPSDIWLTGAKITRAEFLERHLVSNRSILSVNKRIISLRVQSFDEFHDLVYLARGMYMDMLLLLENVRTRNRLEIEVFVQIPCLCVMKRNDCLDKLKDYFGVSKLATRLKIIAFRNFVSDLTRLLETGNFANITHFSLYNTKINEAVSSPLGLRYMPRLQTIDLHGCDIGDAGVSFLGKELGLLKELKEINVAGTGISAEGLQDLGNGLSDNHGIRALRLQNNTFDVEGAVVLAGWLKRLYLLETLNISGCGIGDLGAKYISKSFVSKVLRQLSMRENEITKEGSVIFFENMRSKNMVEHLDFGRNKVFDDSEITVLEGQVRFDMSDGPEVQLASFLQEQAHWSHLNLWACNLGAVRIFHSTEKFNAMKDLVNLCLQSNQIDDQFAEDVGACLKMHCEHIRSLNLKHNRIGNVGAIAIADGIANKKYLKELLIDRNQIEKEGVSKLLETTLRIEHPMTLDVSCNSLAKFDIDNLEHELSLEVSTSGDDLAGLKENTRIFVPRDNKAKIQIYM